MQRHVFEPRVNVQARNIPVKAFVVVKLLPLQIKHDQLSPLSPVWTNST